MLSEKPWKSEAILRLGLSLFLCQFLGALALGVARYFAGDRPLNVWGFFVLVATSIGCCGAALFVIRKPWELDRFMRRFLFLIVFVYLGLTAGAFVLHYAGRSGGNYSAARAVVAALSFQGAALVLVHRFLHEHGLGWVAGFGFSINWLRAVLYGVLVACAFLPLGQIMQIVSSEIMTRLHVAFESQAAVQALKSSTSWFDRAALGVVAIGLAPVAEELLFRGLIYPAVKRAGFPWLALWGTSLFFAVIHFNLATFLPLLVLALVLTWLYEQTGNLLAPIVAHATFNALQFSMFYLLPVATEKFEWLRRLGVNE